ncbi:acyl-CoA dehydrogenase family protein [Actinoplanes sp. NPDC049265]|uniref:acyl-CoA dehydrogenase family protein n=1 Tax=Actinoplanes sp. NPDC049265 TaxID=3363902 RepID=UPI00371DC406
MIDGATIRILADNAAHTETERRPAPASLDAVRQVGGFGGYAGSTPDLIHAIADFARGCPSTAWIVATSTTMRMLVEGVGEPVRSKLLADPGAIFAGSIMPTGRAVPAPGGVRVSGRFPNVSGAADATWFGFGVLVEQPDGRPPQPMTAYLEPAGVTIEDTWRVAGMRGTGSHTVTVDDVLVPVDHLGPPANPQGADFNTYALTVLATTVGSARGALDRTQDLFASGKKVFLTPTPLAESPVAQAWQAEVTELVEAAENTMEGIIRAADQPPATHAAALKSAVTGSLVALDKMLDLHGLGGFAESNPVQRFWRDAMVGSRHPLLNRFYAAHLASLG